MLVFVDDVEHMEHCGISTTLGGDNLKEFSSKWKFIYYERTLTLPLWTLTIAPLSIKSSTPPPTLLTIPLSWTICLYSEFLRCKGFGIRWSRTWCIIDLGFLVLMLLGWMPKFCYDFLENKNIIVTNCNNERVTRRIRLTLVKKWYIFRINSHIYYCVCNLLTNDKCIHERWN